MKWFSNYHETLHGELSQMKILSPHLHLYVRSLWVKVWDADSMSSNKHHGSEILSYLRSSIGGITGKRQPLRQGQGKQAFHLWFMYWEVWKTCFEESVTLRITEEARNQSNR